MEREASLIKELKEFVEKDLKFFMASESIGYAITIANGIVFNKKKVFNKTNHKIVAAKLFFLLLHETAYYKRFQTQGGEYYFNHTPNKFFKREAGRYLEYKAFGGRL